MEKLISTFFLSVTLFQIDFWENINPWFLLIFILYIIWRFMLYRKLWVKFPFWKLIKYIEWITAILFVIFWQMMIAWSQWVSFSEWQLFPYPIGFILACLTLITPLLIVWEIIYLGMEEQVPWRYAFLFLLSPTLYYILRGKTSISS